MSGSVDDGPDNNFEELIDNSIPDFLDVTVGMSEDDDGNRVIKISGVDDGHTYGTELVHPSDNDVPIDVARFQVTSGVSRVVEGAMNDRIDNDDRKI